MGAMLQFDEDQHRYAVNGVPVPGVTAVLSWLSGYDKVPGGYLEAAAFRGTWVHRATELIDEDDLDWPTVPAEYRPYCDAWCRFREETGFCSDLTEHKVFSKRHWYAGTLDRAGAFEKMDEPPSVIDIKTTAQIHPVVALQTAAYHGALVGKAKYKARATVQLKPNGRYHIEWYKKKDHANDYARFLAALTLYQWSNQDGNKS